MIDLRLWRRLFTYTRGLSLWVTVAFLVMIVGKAVEVIIPIGMGRLMDRVLAGESIAIGWVLAALVFAAYLLEGSKHLLLNFVGQRAVLRLRAEVFDHVQKLHVAFFDTQRTGGLVSRTIADIDRVHKGFTEGLIAIVGSLLLFIGILIGMFLVSWRIAALTTLALPVVFALTWIFRHKQRAAFAAVRRTLGKINIFLQEHLMGIGVIRNFALEKQEQAEFDGFNEQYRQDNMRTIRAYAAFNAALAWTQSIILIIVFVAMMEFGSFNAGIFFTFNLYLITLFRPLRELAERYNVLQDAFAAAERVFGLLDEKIPLDRNGKQELGPIHSITFENVWFAYEGEEWILQDVSFEVPEHTSLALVGETGAGKTTIVSLLVRFYQPQKGRIAINGVDVRDYSLKSLRRQFNLVLQDPFIFSGSVAENVALYDESISRELIESSLDYVGAGEFIAPERAAKSVSVGEKQLVSLARAVAHPASALILDEATANIDPATEAVIQKALAKLLEEKTSIVVAHRLSTIRQSHQILVLHAGRIVERGTHQQLIALSGLYWKLHQILA